MKDEQIEILMELIEQWVFETSEKLKIKNPKKIFDIIVDDVEKLKLKLLRTL